MRRWSRRLGRCDSGATAVEFSLIALPFFALLFGIIELALIFVMSTSLDNATSTVSRTVRTGTIKTSGNDSAPKFREQICNNLGWLASECSSNLAVEVKTFPTFNDVAVANPYADRVFKQNLPYNSGCEGDIVLVRSYYKWTLFTPLLSKAVENLGSGKTLISSTTVFKNEPYGPCA
jgi:Flp pilus assembly protein TadG